MKRLLLIVALCVVTQGQQGTKPERAPVPLSPEASKQWVDLNLRIENMRLQQQLIQARSHVPEDYRLAGVDDQGRVLFVPPPEQAKPSPTKEKP